MNDKEIVSRSRIVLVISSLLAAVCVALALRMPRALESFRGIFEELGTTLPRYTQVALNLGWVWWVLAVGALAQFAWVAARSRLPSREYARMKLALRVLVAMTALAYGFAALAIYTPMMQMRAVT